MIMRRRPTPILLGLAASAVALFAQWSGLLRPLELLAMDGMMRLRGPQSPDSRVVICDIDAASIDAYGQWPWSRGRMAELIDRLSAADVRVIALDIVFSEPGRKDDVVDLGFEDEELARAIAAAGNVVLGFYFRREAPRPADGTESPGAEGSGAEPRLLPIEQVLNPPPGGFPVPDRAGVEPNIEPLNRVAASQGFFSNERRSSGVLRYYDLTIAHQGRYYPALALRSVALFAGASLRLSPKAGDLPLLELIMPGGESRPVVTDEKGGLWVNYRGPAGTYATYSAADVLGGRVGRAELAGSLVFLGASETGIGDLQSTPFGSEMPGVEVHANVADNLLHGNYIRDTGFQGFFSLAALLAIGPVVGQLVGGGKRYLFGSLVAIALVLAWPALCYGAFVGPGWHLQAVSPAASGLLTLVAALRYQVVSVDRRAREIRGAFSRYVSAAVVEEILKDPDQLRLGGERRRMTVLFSDIRGFTNLSEHMDPEGVVRLLNRFFTPMTRVVLAAGGTLDKYMGDALMAFFGAPAVQADHAARACRGALAMRDELSRLNRIFRDSGELAADAHLAIGVGLNTGEMAVGNMGSEEVFDYTVIGDAVNLGSRIEGLNKLYGTEILVSETTREEVGEEFLFREVDRVRVKGKETPVTLYELLAPRPAPPESNEKVRRFEAALALYRDREFRAAAELFTALREDFGDDGPARLYQERSRRFAAEPPPANWDGVETLTVK